MSQPPTNSQPTTPYAYGAYQTTAGGSYPTGAYPAAAYSAPSAYQSAAGQAGAFQTATGWPYPYGYYHTQANSSTIGTSTPRPPTVYPAVSTSQRPSTPATTATPVTTASSFQQYNPALTPLYARDASAAPAAGAGGSRSRNKANFKGLFTKELRNLMYGFGDDRNPANDTVNVMEEILIEYIVDVCQTAASGRKTRLSIEDLRKALARPADAKKLARMEELLFMQEDIKRARAQINEPEMEAKNYG